MSRGVVLGGGRVGGMEDGEERGGHGAMHCPGRRGEDPGGWVGARGGEGEGRQGAAAERWPFDSARTHTA